MNRTRNALLVITAAAGLMVTAACGTKAPTTAPSTGASSETSTAAQSSGVKLVAKSVGNLGTVLVDGNGYTLYRFDKDTNKPAVSNCDGTCATSWPPVLAGTGDVTVSGVDKALVGTVVRKDGSTQVTVNGWPLYRYSKDTKPGDANGQGVGGTWYACTPDGKKATASTPAATTSTGGSYMY